MTDNSADEVLVSSLSFKAVSTTERVILAGLLIHTQFSNTKTYMNIRCSNLSNSTSNKTKNYIVITL